MCSVREHWCILLKRVSLDRTKKVIEIGHTFNGRMITPSSSNYNSESSSFNQQQSNFGGSISSQQTLNSYGPSGFNQQPVGNTYSSSNNGLLTPQVQLQQPFINGNSKPIQSFSAPSTYTSPLTSNYAIQTPFAPAISSNSNEQGNV